MKITFAEFKAWHEEAWPEGYIWVGESAMPDGRDFYAEDGGLNPDISPSEVVNLDDLEGLELEDRSRDAPTELDLAQLVRAWRKRRNRTPVVVSVPNAEVDAFKAICAERGWKVTYGKWTQSNGTLSWSNGAQADRQSGLKVLRPPVTKRRT